jgi:lipopolysaccharide transport system permease protein
MGPNARWLQLLLHFSKRDLKQRYLGSLSGAAWAFLNPLFLLGIYSVIFVHVLKVRLPGELNDDFVVFIVGGLWPWIAFSEALNRSVTALTDHAGLLSKVALPREILILAPVLSGFLLQWIGFIFVCLVMMCLGKQISFLGLASASVGFIVLAIFAAGLALVLSPIQVFMRDLSHVLGQVLTLWFFLTPIFYAENMAPQALGRVLEFNPLNPFIQWVRAAVLGHQQMYLNHMLECGLIALFTAIVGGFVFRRLRGHIEDFL